MWRSLLSFFSNPLGRPCSWHERGKGESRIRYTLPTAIDMVGPRNGAYISASSMLCFSHSEGRACMAFVLRDLLHNCKAPGGVMIARKRCGRSAGLGTGTALGAIVTSGQHMC